MNTIDFTLSDGFPFDQDVLGFIQDNIILASKSAAWGGNFAIISGCDIAGANAGNGFVFMNGEILPFLGGAIDTKVIVVETATNVLYEDNVERPVKKIRYATFGDDGATNYLWTDFKRNTSEGVLARLERLERVAAPMILGGGMWMWNRPAIDIPAGWAEVVDWRGRLPMGVNTDDVDFNIVGKPGGFKKSTITQNQTPKPAGLSSNFEVGSRPAFGSGPVVYWPKTISGAVAATEDLTFLNPYRTVYFIEYIGE